jgi:hypothetical protein
MPTKIASDGRVIHSVMYGRLTNAELMAHYDLPVFHETRASWLEIVDARDVTEMMIDLEGQRQLAERAAKQIERLRGGRVAMVATADLVYGMFRMWEMRREELDYEVRVFRAFDDAVRWITPE